MVQYRKQWKGNLGDPLSRWLAWLNKVKGEKLAAEVAKMDAAIQAANDRMVYVTGDEDAIRAYEMRMMALSDYTSTMNYARDTGLQRGLKKGLKKGQAIGRSEEKLEIARKMKKAGRPYSEIMEFTGLSLDTIEKLE
jgi:predicted transposase/invertase (TIGR01784 family)